ncbi:hypothetical protein NL108_009929 [Boleophthalmus pectinirostris]|nr:hypothetical protein NL108_009929 [Boleophthalmus pectinirostris]
MRGLLGLALILLFLWLQKSHMSSSNYTPCKDVSLSDSTVSLLLSPLSLYSWLMSTTLRLVLSLPALVLNILHHSWFLLMAFPWCIASISLSFVFTILQVALYLLHLSLVLAVVAILTLSKSHLAKQDMKKKNISSLHKVSTSRVGHQG